MRKFVPLTIVIVGWVIAAVLIGLGWFEVYYSVLHESRGLIPAGYFASLYASTGLAVGFAGNGVSAALKS